MLEENVDEILRRLDDKALVLDIGGWARPFNRANYVIDAEPYETRGFYSDPKKASERGWYAPAQGGTGEWFSRSTWIRRDICDKNPFPFRDKEIDFVICSHTLEDVRDPLWVCSEMIRVAKRGYIEVPSRLAESSRGMLPNQVGWTHHRWLVEIADNHVYFTMKYHMIHSHWRFSLPANKFRRLPERSVVQWLFWENSFEFSENTIHGPNQIAENLEEFIRQNDGYPEWLLQADRRWRTVLNFVQRGSGKIRRTLRSRRGANERSAQKSREGM
ncbi:MAG TPA: methyltransferase domain-containing protein [Candidatus Binataceae bacterium]|nr:methyltransferase domain-containing protein [Candidatus Binataceae bacterium]